MTKPSTFFSVHHPIELALGRWEVVWGCGDSTVLGTYLSVLLSEVSLPPLTLVSPHIQYPDAYNLAKSNCLVKKVSVDSCEQASQENSGNINWQKAKPTQQSPHFL